MILYQLIVYVVVILAFIVLISHSVAGGLIIPDGMLDEVNNRLSLLLSGMGAVAAMIPLGILYALFRSRQESARQQEEEERQARKRQEELWRSFSQFESEVPAKPDPGPMHLKLDLRSSLRIVILGFALCICVNALLLSIPIPWDSFDEVSELLYAPPLIHQIICIGLIVPLAEELVFRGLGYARMRLMLPMVPAMVISALYFGIYHGNLVQGVYAAVLGLVLAWLMEVYDSLFAVYLLHAAANLMSILLSNTLVGIFLYVFTLRCGLILICSGITIFILYKIREDRLDYETSVDCNTML